MRGGTRVPGSTVSRGLVARGKVLSRLPDGSVKVDLDEEDPIVCHLLEASGGPPLELEAGDVVLVWQPGGLNTAGIVLGRVDRGETRHAGPRTSMPDELLLEAKKGLVLRVGEGSITIRADGKILIKGKDLVSHAKRMNRIKGGAVSLN